MLLGGAGGGVGLGTEKCVVGGVFPSPGEYRHANVSDGANVRCCSEAPVIVRYVTALVSKRS